MKKPSSEFVQSALDLDEIFAGVEQIAHSLDQLELDSEAELERAKKLLIRFSEKSTGLQGALETLLRTLDDRRGAVERAVATVNQKAPRVAQKFQEAEEKLSRLQDLADRVKDLSLEARQMGSEEVRKRLKELMAEATTLQWEARVGKLRSLEKNAGSLRASLKEISRKLG